MTVWSRSQEFGGSGDGGRGGKSPLERRGRALLRCRDWGEESWELKEIAAGGSVSSVCR
jgi:hypothetical protein